MLNKERNSLFFKDTIGSDDFEFEKILENIDKESYRPSVIDNKTQIFENLGLPTKSSMFYDLDTSEISVEGNKSTHVVEKLSRSFSFDHEVKFQQWRLLENISSKLISYDDNSVLLECLIDRENKIYEEREFKRSLFCNYNLDTGKLFKVCIYERDNQMMLEIKDNPELVLETDFPFIDFYSEFGNMTLNKKSEGHI